MKAAILLESNKPLIVDEIEYSNDVQNTKPSTPSSEKPEGEGTGYEGYESDSVETTSKTTPSTTSNTNSVQQGKKSFIGPLDNDVVEQ